MVGQVMRIIGLAIAKKPAYQKQLFTNLNQMSSFKKALIPMLFMQETSRSMSSTSPPGKIQEPTSELATSRRQPAMLTKSLELRPHPKNKNEPNKQIAVLLSWLLAKPRHLHKYDSFYSKHGFDVLYVRTTPWQLLWPAKGTKMIALDILNFLEHRTAYENILIHGFSVGAYLYGEMLLKMENNKMKYENIEKRIIGQVFDSAVDYDGMPLGLSKSVTQNKLFQNAIQAYVSYHLRTFYDSATTHYITSSECFHNNGLKVPSLFLFSKDDPVATVEGCMNVVRMYEAKGNQVFTKCWDSSPHVSHFYRHPTEYIEELSAFLDRLGLLAEPIKKATVKN